MLSKEELYSNINTQWGISIDYWKTSRYGLCYYISDICNAIRVPNEVASIAMYLTNFFYVRKCYLNYSKLPLACAAILIASKEENSPNKFNEISKEYFRSKSIILKEDTPPIYSTTLNQEIKDLISKYEIILLKSIDFKLKIQLPNDYIYVYSAILYPDNEIDIDNVSIPISNDSFFTFANNIYPNYVVALSCVVIAAKFLDLPTVFETTFKNWSNMRKINTKDISVKQFDKLLLGFGTKLNEGNVNSMELDDSSYFDTLSLGEKLYPGWKEGIVVECIEMIMEYYQDNKEIHQKNVKKQKSNVSGNAGII